MFNFDRMKYINIHISSYCNFNCDICFENKAQKNINYNDIIAFLQDINPIHVGLVGGEPCMYPQINDFIDYVKNTLNIEICLVTNGCLLNNLTVLPNTMSVGIDNIIENNSEFDSFLASVDSEYLKNIIVSLTPDCPDLNQLDNIINHYKNKGIFRFSISLLAFWQKNSNVISKITSNYIAKIKELKKRTDVYVGVFGESEDWKIDAFYNSFLSLEMSHICNGYLNIYSDGHLEFCDLESFPIHNDDNSIMTITNYNKEKLYQLKSNNIIDENMLNTMCASCNLRRIELK